MKIPNIIIAVDGCSSTGKSTFAKMLASELGFTYLDSGALYRGVTLFAMENSLISSSNEVSPGLRDALKGVTLRFGPMGLCLGERLIEKTIRTMEVSSRVSPVSAVPFVREFVDGVLHALAADGRVVMDGRDIGTTVFPNAEVKIFMTASEEVRARRRYDEMVGKGEHPLLEDVLKNLRERDYIDSHREVSPLKQSPEAFVLDNSAMTIGEEIAWAKGVIQGRFGILE